jgi:hypothetical protein
VLRCERADSTVTWQRQERRHAAFFPLHDLTHYAVETELGFRRGFYGLIAEGWDITDTTGKGARGPLPREALTVERIVGAFDMQRASGTPWAAQAFNEQAALQAMTSGDTPPRHLTDDELDRVRARTLQLFSRWTRLPTGGTLELMFDPGAAGTNPGDLT